MQKACNARLLASEGLGVTISSFTKGDEIHKASVLLSSVQHIHNSDTLVHCVSVPCGVLCFLNRNSPLQHVVHCSHFWKTFRTSVDHHSMTWTSLIVCHLWSFAVINVEMLLRDSIVQLAMRTYVFSVPHHQIWFNLSDSVYHICSSCWENKPTCSKDGSDSDTHFFTVF